MAADRDISLRMHVVEPPFPGRTVRGAQLRMCETLLQSYLDSVALAPSFSLACTDSALARGFAQGLRAAGVISHFRYAAFSDELEHALERHLTNQGGQQ